MLSNPTKVWEKALPLPSSNWLEMMDYWGAAEGAFEHIPRDGIHASPGRIYVGSSDLLLHPSNLVASTIDDPSHTAATTGHPYHHDVVCPSCSATLGFGKRENSYHDVHLYKHSIQTAEIDLFSSYSCDSVLSAQILEAVESEGIFRFEVFDDTDAMMATLQVLSWDATLQTSEYVHPRNAIKVLYRESEGQNGEDTASLSSRKVILPSMIAKTVYYIASCTGTTDTNMYIIVDFGTPRRQL